MNTERLITTLCVLCLYHHYFDKITLSAALETTSTRTDTNSRGSNDSLVQASSSSYLRKRNYVSKLQHNQENEEINDIGRPLVFFKSETQSQSEINNYVGESIGTRSLWNNSTTHSNNNNKNHNTNSHNSNNKNHYYEGTSVTSPPSPSPTMRATTHPTKSITGTSTPTIADNDDKNDDKDDNYDDVDDDSNDDNNDDKYGEENNKTTSTLNPSTHPTKSPTKILSTPSPTLSTSPSTSPTEYIPFLEREKQKASQEEKEIIKLIHDPTADVLATLFAITAVLGMLYTAHQMLEKPDGLCASCCRLSLTITSFFIRLLCIPCSIMCGYKYKGYTGTDANNKAVFLQAEQYTNELELT